MNDEYGEIFDPVRAQIEDIILARNEMGAITHGPWKTPYERKHSAEMLGEVIDLSVYAARCLVQWSPTLDLLDEIAQRAAARVKLGAGKEEAILCEFNQHRDELIRVMTDVL